MLKALCLGARGVGLGRAFLYGNALWGEGGCQRVIESTWFLDTASAPRKDLMDLLTVPVMREEILTGMRLMGKTKVEELGPELVRYVGEAGRARL